VQGIPTDTYVQYTLPAVVDATVSPFHWNKITTYSNPVILTLPKFEYDLPIRHIYPYTPYFDRNYHNFPHALPPYFQDSKIFKILPRPGLNSNPIYQLNLLNLTPDVPWVTNSHSSNNLYLGFRKRISSSRPRIHILKLHALENFVLNFLEENIKPIEKLEDDFELLFNIWLNENQSYSPARKLQLRKLFAKMLASGNIWKLTEKDYACKSFIKREMYEIAKFLRLINSRTDRFKILVGPFIHHIEKILYNKFYKNGSITSRFFVKGTNPRDMPQMIQKLKKYPYFLETDYSSFEGSFDPTYVDVVECALWRHIFKNNPHVLDTVMRCYYSVNTNNGAITYKPRTEKLLSHYYTARVVGARMSGEMWTSLANGFSNLMNMLFIAHINGIKLDGFIEGDDGIFGMDSLNVAPIDFQDLGFDIKMKIHTNLEDTDFCGNIFSLITNHALLPPEQIVRLAWTHSSIYFHAKKPKLIELLRMKVMSTYVLGKYTPILGPLCSKIISFIGFGPMLHEVSTRWWDALLDKYIEQEKFEPVTICPDDRILYQHRFGIDITTQLALERIIETCTTLENLYLPYSFLATSMDSLVRLSIH